MADQMKHEQNTPKAPDTTSGNVLTTTNERRAELNKKLSVKAVDMEGDMEKDAIIFAQESMKKYAAEKEMAAHIKDAFDAKYLPTWHCVVGKNFGSYVTHEVGQFIYFYLGQYGFLLFKSG